MPDHTSPQPKHPKLIVVMAFDRDEEGELQPAFDPMEQQSEDRAIRIANDLASKHAGVIAWSREANPALGEYGARRRRCLPAVTCRIWSEPRWAYTEI